MFWDLNNIPQPVSPEHGTAKQTNTNVTKLSKTSKLQLVSGHVLQSTQPLDQYQNPTLVLLHPSVETFGRIPAVLAIVLNTRCFPPSPLFSSGLPHPGHRLLAREHSGDHSHHQEQELALAHVLFHLQVNTL